MPVTPELVRIGKTTAYHAHAIVDAVAVGNGSWFDASGVADMTVHVAGITTATVIVSGSNAPTIPADSTHGATLATVTADSIVDIQMPVRWIKARVSAWTSGTINAYVEGGM